MGGCGFGDGILGRRGFLCEYVVYDIGWSRIVYKWEELHLFFSKNNPLWCFK